MQKTSQEFQAMLWSGIRKRQARMSSRVTSDSADGAGRSMSSEPLEMDTENTSEDWSMITSDLSEKSLVDLMSDSEDNTSQNEIMHQVDAQNSKCHSNWQELDDTEHNIVECKSTSDSSCNEEPDSANELQPETFYSQLELISHARQKLHDECMTRPHSTFAYHYTNWTGDTGEKPICTSQPRQFRSRRVREVKKPRSQQPISTKYIANQDGQFDGWIKDEATGEIRVPTKIRFDGVVLDQNGNPL